MNSVVVKQPGEDLRHAVQAAGLAPFTDAAIVAITPRGLVAGGAELVATVAIVAGLVQARLTGGADGERYLVTIRATDHYGSVVESEVEVVVIDAAWSTPDGGAAYLSISAFIQRFGLDETVRMTDANGSGRIDRGLLVDALTDAQAIAESELAGRYALPLATVPRIVAMAIADLARARLYPRGAPEGVETAAKAATRTLERIASGALQLGLPAIETPPATAPSEAPVMILSGRRAYPDGLVDF